MTVPTGNVFSLLVPVSVLSWQLAIEVRELSRCVAEVKMSTGMEVGCGWNVDMLTGRCDPVTRWFLFLNIAYVWNFQWNFSSCQNTCVSANKTFSVTNISMPMFFSFQFRFSFQCQNSILLFQPCTFDDCMLFQWMMMTRCVNQVGRFKYLIHKLKNVYFLLHSLYHYATGF